MNGFTYFIPTRVEFGRQSLEKLADLLIKGGHKQLLLHYGGESAKRSGLLDRVLKQVEKSGANYTALGGVNPNPKVELVREGVRLCKEKQIDFILAVGGGSVIDSAKAIALGAKMDRDIWDVFERKCSPDQAVPIGCVLTIAAAGSEMAGGMVVSNAEKGLKRDYGSECLRPVFCIEDPTLTYSVSRWQTACGIVDILMHTMERYFSPTRNTELTDEIAEGLMRAVIRAGRVVCENPEDYEARATLMWASSLSQNDLTGMGRQADWATHQLEHDLSGMYDNVSHGAGLAVLFPAWARYVMDDDPERFCQFANKVWGLSDNCADRNALALGGIQAAADYFAALGMPRTLKSFGVESDRLPEMAEKCSFSGTRTLGSVKKLSCEDMLAIYRMAYEG
ncbi:iron-containing alcohol dehydrogenase [Eubacteriales bacterium OttesenSCG-928-N13]|nr:iron-containing alcohol dehydrogenase [Eubacteriales bacterium OttesenSCG-928-N13]